MAQLFVHVGYPKCASTTLQRQVFACHSGLCYLDDEAVRSALLQRSVASAGDDFQRAEVLSRLEAIADREKRPVVLSCEHFCMPGRWLETRPHAPTRRHSRDEITELLREYAPHVRVLVVVRNQSEWVRSWYQERVKRYESHSLKGLLRSDLFIDQILPALHYYRTVQHYRSVFGEEAVTLVPLELLHNDADVFFARLFEPFGLDPTPTPESVIKTRMSSAAVRMRRQTNRVLRLASRSGIAGLDRALFRLSKWIYSQEWVLTRSGLTREYAETVQLPPETHDSLARDNARLAVDLGIDLGALGYPIAIS